MSHEPGAAATVSIEATPSPERGDFIREIVAADLRDGKHQTIVTRFPPEPNGYLHIGHAKSICLNFGVAQRVRRPLQPALRRHQSHEGRAGVHRLIQADVRWLGFDWGEHLYFASDYFEQLYEWAVYLIKAGKAYVDDLTADEIREHRGTLTEPGKNSPWRDRSIEENLDLFERMRTGEFPNGARVLRAKIDMASPNMNMRDPAIYRILHADAPAHRRQVVHLPDVRLRARPVGRDRRHHALASARSNSRIHRPLYDWFIENLPVPSTPRQIEFARLNLTYTVLSKRVLLKLVNEGHVRGWDDPRMPTISGLRRRGFPAEGDPQLRGPDRRRQERQHRGSRPARACHPRRPQPKAPRALRGPGAAQGGRRELPRGPGRGDGSRQQPGGPVGRYSQGSVHARAVDRARRLHGGAAAEVLPPRAGPRGAAALRVLRDVREVVKDAAGEIVELRCTYDPATRGGDSPDGRRPKATLHWISAAHAMPAEVRLYDHLFTRPDPGADGDLFADLNPDSEKVLQGCLVEPTLAEVPVGETVQFERLGYFCPDPDSTPGHLVFNRTLTLKDTWAKLQAQGKQG